MYIKPFLVCLVILVAASSALTAVPVQDDAGKLYSRQIFVAPEAAQSVQESATTLARWLGKMTGTDFPVIHTPGRQGIYLVLEHSPVLPAIDLKALHATDSPEGFLLYSSSDDQLWIVGKSALGLDHGVYWYLTGLGCRWLHPSDRWTIVPKRDDITVKINTVQAPAFIDRNFSGSGGFGRPAIDPVMRLYNVWEEYKRQNFYGQTLPISGHAGEVFMTTNKQEILAHPEYMAEIGGTRQPWGISTKPCYANPGLQALYVKHFLGLADAAMKRNPGSTFAISVDPSDGGGHCECAACKKLGTISDAVYAITNLVATAIAQKYPGNYVSLFGYWEHAAPPAAPLEPNVIVVVVPYGLHRTGLEPDELIEAWTMKSRFLGVYTYWNIADWVNCLPDFDYRTIPGLVRGWQKSHLRIVMIQSSYCGGNMGPAHYLASRMCWNPAQDEKAIMDDYFQAAFGEARVPMRRMIDRWSSGFMYTDHELGASFRDVNEALALAKDAGVRARVLDMGRYVQYLRLWGEYTGTPEGPERVERGQALLNYLWGIYDSSMVQTFRQACQIVWGAKGTLDDYKPEAPRWAKYPQVTDDEVVRMMREGAASFQPLLFTEKTFSSQLIPLRKNVKGPVGPYVMSNTFGVGTHFLFSVQDNTVKQLILKLRVYPRPEKSDHVRIFDPSGKIVFDEFVLADGEWKNLSIAIRATGNYRIAVTDQKNFFTWQVPADLPFACIGDLLSIDLSPRLYFFVPRGQRQVAMYAPSALPIKLSDPDGKPVKVERNEKGNSLFVIDIPEGMDGRCWSFTGLKTWTPPRMLNVPNIFAYAPDGMIVPEEARPK